MQRLAVVVLASVMLLLGGRSSRNGHGRSEGVCFPLARRMGHPPRRPGRPSTSVPSVGLEGDSEGAPCRARPLREVPTPAREHRPHPRDRVSEGAFPCRVSPRATGRPQAGPTTFESTLPAGRLVSRTHAPRRRTAGGQPTRLGRASITAHVPGTHGSRRHRDLRRATDFLPELGQRDGSRQCVRPDAEPAALSPILYHPHSQPSRSSSDISGFAQSMVLGQRSARRDQSPRGDLL